MDNLTDAQRALVERFATEHDVPGIAIAIVGGGTLVAAGGHGTADLARGAPVTARTVWPIASLTKSFAALAAMQQVEAGRVDLDAPVTDVLPWLRVCAPDVAPSLTLRRLLTHGGGLGRTGHQDRTREEVPNPYPTRRALLEALGEARLQSAPGAVYSYSNEGYAIVGHVVETLAGKPLEAVLREDVLARTGMADSDVTFARWREASDRAVPYAGEGAGPFDSGERHDGRVVVRLVEDYQTFLSTGGVVSTAADLARYQVATMDYGGGALGLSAGGLDAMHAVQRPYGDTGWGYGLGWQVMWSGATRVIGHSGGLPGVSNYQLLVPAEGAGVVVLTNRGDRKAFTLAEQLIATVRGPLWRARPDGPLPFTTRHRDTDLGEYAGTYRFRKGPADVVVDGDLLVLRTPSRYDGPDQTLRLRAVAPDRFLGIAEGSAVSFVRDAAGRIVRFVHTGYAYERE